MRRSLASLTLAVSILAASRLNAAAPPMPEPPPFTMTTPRGLDDLKALEARVQWVMAKVMPAVVGLGGGSGVVVSPDGLVLTVAHVGGKANKDVAIIFPSGKRARGKTLGNYKGVDAGMARITQKGTYPFAPLGRSDTLKVGQWVVTMGFPVSFAKGEKPPVRVGRILQVAPNAIVTDCPMMGGDSGGPVFDLDGRVVGQNSRVTGGNSVLGNVHVPVNVYRTHWKRLLAGEDWGTAGGGRGKSSVDTAYQQAQPKGKRGKRGRGPGVAGGLQGERSHDTVKEAFSDATRPSAKCVVRVLCDGKAVALGTVADAAGLIVTKASLLKGDEIVCVLHNGRKVEAEKVGEDKESDLAVLRVEARGLRAAEWREGAPDQGSLVAAVGEKGAALALGTVIAEPRLFALRDRAPRAAAGSGKAFLGVGVEEDDGLRVSNVAPGSAADKAGLKEGDHLKKISDKAVKSLADLRAVLEKLKAGDKVALLVERNGKSQKLTATLGQQTAGPPGLAFDRWGGGPFSERRFGFGKVLPVDVPVSPWDCGGPLVDTSGKVVGVSIARALRVSTYVLLPEDVRRIVAKHR